MLTLAQAVDAGFIKSIVEFGSLGIVAFVIYWVFTRQQPARDKAFTDALDQQRADFLTHLKVRDEAAIAKDKDFERVLADEREMNREMLKSIQTMNVSLLVHDLLSRGHPADAIGKPDDLLRIVAGEVSVELGARFKH